MSLHLESFPAHIRRWSIDDFDKLVEIGLIAMRGYELMDGIVYNTSGVPRRWSLRDYEQMVNAGLLTWEQHAELVDGYVVTLPHPAALQSSIRCRTNTYMTRLLDDDSVLFSGAGHCIVFDDANLACPDFCMLRWQDDLYREAWPRGSDVFAIMDVSAPLLVQGSDARRRQFARFNVPEFWHADAGINAIIIHRAPADSEYTDVRTYGHGESFTSEALGGITIPVDALLGSRDGDDW